VPRAAEELLNATAEAAGSRTDTWHVVMESLWVIWDKFNSAWYCLDSLRSSSGDASGDGSGGGSSGTGSSRGLPAPSDWLQASFVQVADKLLQQQLESFGVMHSLMMRLAAGAADHMAHPQLAAAAGLTPDPVLGARMAAVVQHVSVEQQPLVLSVNSQCLQDDMCAAQLPYRPHALRIDSSICKCGPR
jgi:hypothetical protein